VIIAGFDEAGYGPRLGPLVVAWTAFRVEKPGCLWKALRAAVRKDCSQPDTKVWVADSKQVKPRKDGLALLELAALSFLDVSEVAAGRGLFLPTRPTLASVLRALGGDAGRYGAPWYGGLGELVLPAYSWPGEIRTRAARIAAACERAGVCFAGAAALPLPEWEFNSGFLDPDLNKADVMQRDAFTPLLRALRSRFPGEEIEVVADKHGGRDFYAPLLERVFPGASIAILGEGSLASGYRLETEEGPLAIRFEPEADSRHFSVALASMYCKYLREVFMGRLNAFFLERVDRELKPTAGYPGDAERFIAAIEPSLAGLGIARERLVRAR
jgi:ribonuclease HII